MLSAKRRAFCDSVFGGLSSVEAYRLHYKADKLSGCVVEKKAAALLGNADVKGYLSCLEVKEMPADVNSDVISPSDVLRELRKIALYPVDVDNPNGGVVKLSEKQKALELLGKYLGMFKEKVDSRASEVVFRWADDE